MDKRPIGYIPGKGNPLDKLPTKNPKFAHIQKTMDTGLTVNHIEVISDKTIAKRRGELFKRIKSSTLANLLQEDRNTESVYKIETGGEHDMEGAPENQSIYSLPSQKSQMTRMSSVTYATEQLGITSDTDLLLLDIREPEDYELYHIKEAINFPAPNISREKWMPEFYKFKNKEGKIIVMYHLDEKNSIPYGQIMAEKGFENVFLLSGGIEAFLENYSSLCEGRKVPVVEKKPEEKKVIKRSNYRETKEKGEFRIQGKNYPDMSDSISQRIDSTPHSAQKGDFESESVLSKSGKKGELETKSVLSKSKSTVSTLSKAKKSQQSSQFTVGNKEKSVSAMPKWMP